MSDSRQPYAPPGSFGSSRSAAGAAGRGGHRPGQAGAKAALRADTLAARRALPTPVRAAAARRVQAVLRDLLDRSGPGTVTGYLPFGTEPGGPDLPAVLATALGPAGRLLLPVTCPDRSLDWTVYQPGSESASPRLGPDAIGEAGLVVVPALAVDRRGVRLGRGGGSYDRALALAAPQVQVVALLHDRELRVDELPAEPHDRPVSAVITPALGLVPLPAEELGPAIPDTFAGH